MDTIAGIVTGVRPEQRIVFYAQSGGRWWMQPLARDPLFSKIQGDSQWKNATHWGEELALLLDPSDSPPHAIESPPAASGAVASVAVVKGQTADPSSFAAAFSLKTTKRRDGDRNPRLKRSRRETFIDGMENCFVLRPYIERDLDTEVRFPGR
jgi:hypothetical protein